MSTAQSDAGVFELSFRDERYMPFEGAGAVSAWRLELPSRFRPFDYQSINDVILNVSYTAEDHDGLRRDVEAQTETVAGSLAHFLSNDSLVRAFSLRQEFSSAFHRLTQAAVGSPVTVELDERHFPLLLRGEELRVRSAHLLVVPSDRALALGDLAVDVNGVLSDFGAPPAPPVPADAFSGLPSRRIDAAFTGGVKKRHLISIGNAGELAAADGSGLDPDRLHDILIVMEYGL